MRSTPTRIQARHDGGDCAANSRVGELRVDCGPISCRVRLRVRDCYLGSHAHTQVDLREGALLVPPAKASNVQQMWNTLGAHPPSGGRGREQLAFGCDTARDRKGPVGHRAGGEQLRPEPLADLLGGRPPRLPTYLSLHPSTSLTSRTGCVHSRQRSRAAPRLRLSLPTAEAAWRHSSGPLVKVHRGGSPRSCSSHRPTPPHPASLRTPGRSAMSTPPRSGCLAPLWPAPMTRMLRSTMQLGCPRSPVRPCT